jgi:Holliday junction resolvasome RuvABC ATP-dependent DNA helicase subunit
MITQKFGGGPVGLDTLSTAIGEDRGTLEDMVEPYLIQQGFIMRTMHRLTLFGYLKYRQNAPQLFVNL